MNWTSEPLVPSPERLNIIRQSHFIKYTDNQLEDWEKVYNQEFKNQLETNPEFRAMVLTDADPIWNDRLLK